MLYTDPTLISDARSAYDRAYGAFTGSNATGFWLGMMVSFWAADLLGTTTIPTQVIQSSAGLLV